MKRANSFALATTTLLLSSFVSAQDKDPQICAEAAFEVTGETRYELLSARQIALGRDWYRLKLEAEQSGTEVVCKIRRGRITTLHVDMYEATGAITKTS